MKLRIFRLISLDACRFYKKTAFPEICIRPSVIWKSHLMLLIVVIFECLFNAPGCWKQLYALLLFLIIYTQGEVTSQSLWSRYDRHFVGIT